MGEKIFKINIDSTCNPLKAINLNSCSFKDIYTDIPKAFEEGIDKYFSYDESKKDLLPSAIATVIIIGIIYGIYFLATYLGSKNIIKEDE